MKRVFGVLLIIAGLAWSASILLSGNDTTPTGNANYDAGYVVGQFIGQLIIPTIVIIFGVVLVRNKDEDAEDES